MKTKHTHGSWYVAEDQGDNANGNRVIIRTDKGNHPQVAVAIHYNTEANNANAKIMAAGPELLEFAIEMVKRYPNSPWISEQGNKAIQKATK